MSYGKLLLPSPSFILFIHHLHQYDVQTDDERILDLETL